MKNELFEDITFLRRLKREDLKDAFECRNDELIANWCRQYLPISWDHHVKWFESLEGRKDVEMFVIDHNGFFAGVCGLTDIDYINSRAEFSLYIKRELQREKLGTKSLSGLLKVGFNRLNLNLIWGETFEGNPAIKMFEKVGMIKDGTRRQFYFRDGKYIDAHLYSITREEFNARF